MSFLSIQLLKELSYPFHLTYSLSPSLFITFSTLNSFWFVFLQSFLWNVPTISSSLRLLITCPQQSIFYFFNHKSFLRPVWNTVFCQIVFIFSYSNNITNFKVRIFIIYFFNRVNTCVLFYINKFHFNCASICIITFINYVTYFINIRSFWY